MSRQGGAKPEQAPQDASWVAALEVNPAACSPLPQCWALSCARLPGMTHLPRKPGAGWPRSGRRAALRSRAATRTSTLPTSAGSASSSAPPAASCTPGAAATTRWAAARGAPCRPPRVAHSTDKQNDSVASQTFAAGMLQAAGSRVCPSPAAPCSPPPLPHPCRCLLQVATDTRLWLYGQLQLIRAALRELIAAAADRAEAEVDVLMPGFTHLQPAQVRPLPRCRTPAGRGKTLAVVSHARRTGRGGTPACRSGAACLPMSTCMLAPRARSTAAPPALQTVRWSHWLLSHAASWQRDDMRLADLMPRVGTLPLGSGEEGCVGMTNLVQQRRAPRRWCAARREHADWRLRGA